MNTSGPSSSVTTFAGIARMLVATLNSRAIDAQPLLNEVGICLATDSDRVSAQAMQKLWRLAVRESGDDAFGIYCAENIQPTVLHGLGFAWIASNTLLEALERLVRYFRMLVTAGDIVLEDQGERIKLLLKLPEMRPGVEPAPASIDVALAMFIQMCRLTRDATFSPLAVEFQHSAPKNIGTFCEFFSIEPLFSASQNCLYFASEDLLKSLPLANPELARINDQVVSDYLQRYEVEGLVPRVRASIIECLPLGTPSQDDIARSLCQSSRTLQRKLKSEGVSFKDLLEEVRFDLAKRYLLESHRHVAEIAYLLGFSEASNFARSFKRWSGLPPQDYRSGQ